MGATEGLAVLLMRPVRQAERKRRRWANGLVGAAGNVCFPLPDWTKEEEMLSWTPLRLEGGPVLFKRRSAMLFRCQSAPRFAGWGWRGRVNKMFGDNLRLRSWRQFFPGSPANRVPRWFRVQGLTRESAVELMTNTGLMGVGPNSEHRG